MTTLEELRIYAIKTIKNNPNKAEEIQELVNLAFDEVAAGESQVNEVSLAFNEIENLINEI